MESETTLEEKYTDGVWYDRHAGEYVEIKDLGDTIGLCEPGYDEPYYTFDEDDIGYEEAIGNLETDFRPISEEAQENPERIVKRAIRMMSRNDPNELMSYPQTEAIDLRYARMKVTIES